MACSLQLKKKKMCNISIITLDLPIPQDFQRQPFVIIIIIMKIIYIAPNPLKGSRRFTKSVTATLQFT